MEFKKNLTPNQALLKAASYCAYQERCHDEVMEKLSEWGIYGDDAGNILLKLIEQNYLNEVRFAKAFAGGKFRVKHWGRIKINQELKFRKISDYCIRMAMKEINEDDYLETLKKLSSEKYDSIKEKNPLIKKNKTAVFLMSKGYEPDLIWDCLRKIN
jgi:regulatory protein